jgi:hypothetical protein
MLVNVGAGPRGTGRRLHRLGQRPRRALPRDDGRARPRPLQSGTFAQPCIFSVETHEGNIQGGAQVTSPRPVAAIMTVGAPGRAGAACIHAGLRLIQQLAVALLL